MNDEQKQRLIDLSWEMHQEVEQGYLQFPGQKGDENWPDKQRLLLADMALHLLQTALKPGDMAYDKLQNNLHAILTISDQFVPHGQLKAATKHLYQAGELNE